MLIAIALAVAQLAEPWQQVPVGFDQQLWSGMTTDQKIDVYSKITAEPDPLTKDTPEAAVAAIKSMLKDPDSAKFSGIKRRAALDYCGFVNAKNGYGGYVGKSVFFANSKWTVLLPPGASDPKFCS